MALGYSSILCFNIFDVLDFFKMTILGPQNSFVNPGCRQNYAISHWQFAFNANPHRNKDPPPEEVVLNPGL